MPSRLLVERRLWEAEEETPLRIAITYDDPSAGQRAIDILHSLAGRFGDEFEFRTYLWKFELLLDPGAKAAATADLTRADIIILSASSEKTCTPELCAWLADTLSDRIMEDGALVALLGAPGQTPQERSVTCHFLQKAAEAAGLEFLLATPTPECAHLDESLDGLSRRARTMTPLLADILHQKASHPNLCLRPGLAP